MKPILSATKATGWTAAAVAAALLWAAPARSDQPAPVILDKGEVADAVRAYLKTLPDKGASTQYFRVADPDKFLPGATKWLKGVAVDPKFIKDYPSVEGKGSNGGLTFPYDADPKAAGPYRGWIVLPARPDGDPRTTFHEMIHAYGFSVGSDDDEDAKGGAETVSNNFLSILTNLSRIDAQMEAIEHSILAGKDYEDELAKVRRKMELLKQTMSGWDPSVVRCINSIGGKADWDGLQAAYDARIEAARKKAGSFRDLAVDWASDWGPVTFTANAGGDANAVSFSGYWQQGEKMRGQILEGTFDPRTRKLAFKYYQDWNDQHGHVEMTLSEDGQTLSGTWTQESGSGGWTMTRKK